MIFPNFDWLICHFEASPGLALSVPMTLEIGKKNYMGESGDIQEWISTRGTHV